MEWCFVEKALVFKPKLAIMKSTLWSPPNGVPKCKFVDVAETLRTASQMHFRRLKTVLKNSELCVSLGTYDKKATLDFCVFGPIQKKPKL